MSAALIGRWGSSAFRLSTTAVSMSLTGSCFSSLIGRWGSSAFRLSTTAVSMSLTGSCFSSEFHPHHLGDAARVVAVRLIDLRLQHRLHVPRFNTDHR